MDSTLVNEAASLSVINNVGSRCVLQRLIIKHTTLCVLGVKVRVVGATSTRKKRWQHVLQMSLANVL